MRNSSCIIDEGEMIHVVRGPCTHLKECGHLMVTSSGLRLMVISLIPDVWHGLIESGDFEAERNSTVDNTQLSDWAVAVPYIKMVGCITRHPPAQYDEGIRGVQMLGAGKSGTTGKAQTYDHYLVLKLEKGHLKDKVNGSQVDQVVLPWCTSTVDQGCSLM